MSSSNTAGEIFQRLDELNEFERQPVQPDKLCGGGYFAAVFAGEHIAATEFVIGALFVQLGAGAADVLIGLLVGNFLAVLSWALVCAPIAVQTRLTLYWYLRQIAGPVVTTLYNVLNAVLFCVLAGAMITVSASAIRIPLGIAPQVHWYPHDLRFVILVLVVGAVVVVLAIWGFKRLAQFASVCAPWMIAMFLAGGVAALALLGPIDSFAALRRVAEERIWTGHAVGGAAGLGFWHVTAFAWICNLATHLGLSDMALFRYARHPAYGLYSAVGMYVGHYLSWICAGMMGAAATVAISALSGPTTINQLDAGSIAHTVLGSMGALTVVIAGWTTANPTLYRAGLAMQAVTPGWPRWLVTLAVGSATTLVACFPFVFTYLLDFVFLYGIVLMPVGAIVVMEHWVFPRIGLVRYWSTQQGRLLNWPALAAWLAGLALVAVCWMSDAVWHRPLLHNFFQAIPVWFLTAGSYTLLAALAGARRPRATAEDRPVAAPAMVEDRPPAAQPRPPWPGFRSAYFLTGVLALASLLVIVAGAVAVFAGLLSAETYKLHLVALTLIYFVNGTIWMHERESRADPLNVGPV